MNKRFLVSLVLFSVINLSLTQTEEATWTPWGDWTDCSRSCGGGVTQRVRECKLGNTTTDSCPGDNIAYQMCNIQDCPEGAVDFRMQQCSAFNNASYKGKYYKWASFDHSAGECELKCMPKGQFFYVTFARKVIDGTRCHSHTLDRCVNGQCQSVGCDMQLFSDAQVDMCGVCNGDNSTCKYISSSFRLNEDAYDYVDVVTIPSGATHIKIEETGTPSNYISLASNGKNVLNSDYVFVHSITKKVEGTTLKYLRTATENHVTIDGRIELPLTLRVFAFQPEGAVINYSYYVPSTYTGSGHKKLEYEWVSEDWSECSKTCAGGEKNRNVYCRNKQTKQRTKQFNCNKDQKPVFMDVCNTQQCPARWYISEWAECSVSCGVGQRTRRVHCLETLSDGNVKMLELSKCPGSVPHKVETCTIQEKCPQWVTYKWTICSKTCGEGVETRTVHCMDTTSENSVEENKCNLEDKPATEKKCYNAPCGATWEAQEWGKCSANCGRGIRSRVVLCRSNKGYEVPASYCDVSLEPKQFEDCDAEGQCKPEWHSTEWSKCTARCAYGKQMRTVVCAEKESDGATTLLVVDDSLCEEDNKPITVRRCLSKKPCYVNYFVSNWTQCSTTCGTGFQQRSVKCYADREPDHTEKACAKLTKPVRVKLCQIQICDGEPVTVPTTRRTTTQSTTTVTTRIQEASAIKFIGGNAQLHEGDNADFECIVSGYPKPDIRWTINGRPITESKRFSTIDIQGGSRLVILAAILSDAGRLTCTASNLLNIVTKSVEVRVSGVPDIKIAPGSASATEGGSHKITCKATGSPSPRVQWTKDGYSFRGDNGRVIVTNRGITFKRVITTDTGTYRCMGFNSAGSDYASSLLTVLRKSSVKDCYDDNSQADCSVIAQVNLCGLPYYNERCCQTCNGSK